MRPPTAGGYSFWDAASALQKCIRRGMELEACFWAQELQSRYANYVWERLKLICIEDIGAADPTALLYVKAAHEQELAWREKGKLSAMPLMSAVQVMCRAKKSHSAESLSMLLYHEGGPTFEVPDFAYDHHTRQGKALGRGRDYFYEEGLKCHPDGGNPYKDQARRMEGKPIKSWWKDAKARVRSLARSARGGLVEEDAEQTEMF